MQEMWTILRILNWTKAYFEDKGIESPRLDAELLLCAVLGMRRIDLYTHFDQPLEKEELAAYRGYVMRRAKREPVAYILGEKGFLDYTFAVTADTLIPRPETELLVEKILAVTADGPLDILELGVGRSWAVCVHSVHEASHMYLAVARKNAKNLGVTDRSEIIVSDLFEKVPEGRKFDLIVSNPPYIPKKDLAGLSPEVRKEPLGALDGGEDGLDFYRRIVREGMAYLKEDGLFAFEVGIGEGAAAADLLVQNGCGAARVFLDYAGIDRMVLAAKEGTTYADKIMETGN